MTDKKDWDNAFTAKDLKGTVEHSPMFGGALSFMRRKYTRDLAGVDVAVTGVPLDTATSNRPGARFGPRAIRAASTNVSWTRPWPWSFDPLERLAVIDYGDCEFDYGSPASITATVRAHIDGILSADVGTLVLGGDHYATYPILQSYAARHGPLCLVHFDAHSDTWSDDADRIDHGTMLYHAAKQGVIDDSRSVQIGLRTTNDDPLGFNILDTRWVHENGPAAVADEVKQVIGDQAVYLTFDIDCLDPSCAPGTGTPVCGGLSTYQALEIIRGLAGINLVGMDLMEVAPTYDVGEITALAGAALAAEFLCVYAANPLR
ncbi:MAG: agmatinase [Gammaproteobacteria bacterium]|nr:agmatinase [Gammaproteobacteria bacterium]